MPIRGEYLGMGLTIDDLDHENLEYFRHCAEHDFHLQACAQCGRLRYPPTTACPWCMSLQSNWRKVEGRGAVHSYSEVHHAIQPAFRGHTPYLILLVDLDTQKGEPSCRRGPARRRQPCDARRRIGAARNGPPRWHRHPRAHGVQRCRSRPRSAAMDHRRGSAAAGDTLALPARIGLCTAARRRRARPHPARSIRPGQRDCTRRDPSLTPATPIHGQASGCARRPLRPAGSGSSRRSLRTA